MIRPLAVFTVFFALSLVANAQDTERMDATATDATIEKLEQVLPHVPDAKQASQVRLRLGDLYAERARLKDLAAGESNCTDCPGGESDRKTALKYYESLPTSHLQSDEAARVHLQTSHLYKVLGQTTKAQSILVKTLSKKQFASGHQKAHLLQADLAFEAGDLKKAEKHYKASMTGATKDDEVYALYRLSWVQLNLGRTEAALQYMTTAIDKAHAANLTSFSKDLLRDYATMLARTQFTSGDVVAYAQKSPEDVRLANLKFFGEEAERMGNKKGALVIWGHYRQMTPEDQDKEAAEVQLKFAQNFYDLGNYDQTLNHLQGTVNLALKKKCQDCEKVRQDFRSLVITWTKKEKTGASESLSKAYDIYISLAQDDYEAIVWAAQIARDRKDHPRALRLYSQAAQISAKKGQAKDLELILSSALEIGEKSRNDQIYDQALAQYIDLNPNGSMNWEVRYQRALVRFRQKDYEASAAQAETVVFKGDSNATKTRVLAADLALQALELLKQDTRVRDLALKFAQVLPEKKTEYYETARKVTINRLIALLKITPSKNDEIRTERDNLVQFDTARLKTADLENHYRTLLLSSERIADLDNLGILARRIREEARVGRDLKILAGKAQLKVAELKLDFRQAYHLAQEFDSDRSKNGEKELRLGLLAELAGLPFRQHFESYIRRASSTRHTNAIRIKLIRSAAAPWKEFEKHSRALQKTPDLLAEIAVDCHLRSPNLGRISKLVRIPGVARTGEGKYMQSLVERDKLNGLLKRVRQHRLVTGSDSNLKRSLRGRMALLTELKTAYGRANRSGDLNLQARVLAAIVHENAKFAKQIRSLPVPRGLRKSERALYSKLLMDQAKPYEIASTEAEEHYQRLFEINGDLFRKLQSSLTSEDGTTRLMAENEIRDLRPFLTASVLSSFQRTMNERQIRPQTVADAYREVQKSPMNLGALEELRGLEGRRANGPMIAYLDQRIAQLKAEVRR